MFKEYIRKLNGIVGAERTNFIVANSLFFLVAGSNYCLITACYQLLRATKKNYCLLPIIARKITARCQLLRATKKNRLYYVSQAVITTLPIHIMFLLYGNLAKISSYTDLMIKFASGILDSASPTKFGVRRKFYMRLLICKH